MDDFDKTLVYAIIAPCILGIMFAGAQVLFSHTSEGFSELYFENPNDLPKIVDVGDEVNFEFTVVSHENDISNYKYNVSYDDRIFASGSFALMPEISGESLTNAKRKTIKVRLIPNTSSLVKLESADIKLSKLRSNAALGMIYSAGVGSELERIVTSPNGHNILFWDQNDTTRQIDIDLPDRRIFPIELQIGGPSTQKELPIFDTDKNESFAANTSVMEQLGDPSNLKHTNTNSLSDFGYVSRVYVCKADNDHGSIDILMRTTETKYLYAFKRVAIELSEFRSNPTISPKEVPIESEYKIFFWIIVKESPSKLLSCIMR